MTNSQVQTYMGQIAGHFKVTNELRAELVASSPARETLVLTQTEVTSEEARVDRAVQRAVKAAGGRLQVLLASHHAVFATRSCAAGACLR